jgi:molecular chaperone DnaJ
VLGIAKDADQKAIKDAFRSLALKYHPDRNKEPGAEERFKEIAEAYAVLSDPKKRSEYDARGFAGVAGFNREDLFGGINFDDVFGGLNFDFGVDNLFGGLFRRRRQGPPRGANIEVELYVTLQRVAEGGEEKIRLTRPATCPSCHGTGGKTEPRPVSVRHAEEQDA